MAKSDAVFKSDAILKSDVTFNSDASPSRTVNPGTLVLRVLFALIVVALVFAPASTSHAISKKDIKRLVEEYADEGTSDTRKADIIKRFQLGSRATLKKQLGKLVKKKGLGESVFEICGHLSIHLKFKEAQKYVDKGYEAKVLKTIFLDGNKKAQTFLFDRWKKAAAGDGDFEIINSAFHENWVGPKVISMFHDELMGDEVADERKGDIEKILKHQMVPNDDEASKLRTHWKSLYGTFALRSRTFPVKGKNLLLEDGWNDESTGRSMEGVIKFRDKYLLETHAALQLAKLKLRQFKLKIWIMPLTGATESVGVGMKGNALVGARFRDGTWMSTISNSVDGTGPKNTLPAKVGEWNEFTFTNTGQGVLVSINGSDLVLSNIEYGTMAQSIIVSAGSKGRLLVGAVDFAK